MSTTLNSGQHYQCPNPDCDNCQLYTEEEMSHLKRPGFCPLCDTKLEAFSLVDEEENNNEWNPDELEDMEEDLDEEDIEDADLDSGD